METTEAVSKTEAQATPKKKTVDQVSKREKFVPMTDEDGVMVNRLIGIAVDKSDHSRRAFDWYVTNMHRPDNRLAIIHCHSIPDIEVTSDDQGQLLVSSKWKDMANDSYKKCQELLNTYKELCQSKKVHSSNSDFIRDSSRHQDGPQNRCRDY
ncbi:hypothetical protein RF11_01630 [Thelohanellus kitauei]|uniref:UspA domain-containing protein n=1 Tax=Thelohanellus kitauei TaxID=669202 RepID=A0A0C2N8E5_THEKT|nr:hypothetical protein RF11_01630 [Thelohanellus kitauei]